MSSEYTVGVEKDQVVPINILSSITNFVRKTAKENHSHYINFTDYTQWRALRAGELMGLNNSVNKIILNPMVPIYMVVWVWKIVV